MMPFAATRMDLESVTLSESGRQRRSIDNISYMPGVYKEAIQMNSLTKQRDSQTYKTNNAVGGEG